MGEHEQKLEAQSYPAIKRLNYRDITKHWIAAYCLLTALLLVSSVAFGAVPLIIDADSARTYRGYDWYEVLVDDRAEPASLLPLDASFQPATTERVNLGFTQNEVWARFSLQYTAGGAERMVLVVPKPLLDEIEMFSIHGDGRVVRRVSGDAYAADSRPWSYRAFAFELEPELGQRVDYYLRVRSAHSAIHLPLQLASSTSFKRFIQTEGLFLGGYFGVMVALGIGALLVFVKSRQSILALYFMYVASFTTTLASISGYGMLFLWPNSTTLQQFLPTVAAALTVLTGVVFIRQFLSLAGRWPFIDKGMLSVSLFGLAAAAYFCVSSSQFAVMAVIGSALVVCTLALVAFVRCVIAGDQIARYFLFGWAACFFGITMKALDMYGVIPATTFSAYGIYLGSFAEFVALSVALGARLRRSQRQKEAELARTSAELSALNQNLESLVEERTRELQQRNRELGELAIRDSLTSLYNHSTTIELLEQILHQSQRYDFAVAVIMADLDNFKGINDDFGHQVGDAVLETMSQTLLDCVRESDIVGRYGGEEFLIVMPHADALAAREFGERLLADVRQIEVQRSRGRHLTASLGIAVYNPQGPRVTVADLIERADRALYRSKRDGRDCLTVDSLSVVNDASADEGPALVPAKPA